MNLNKLISPVIAIGSYLLIVFSVLYYFNYKSKQKPIVYVEKNTNKIEVALASAPKKSSAQPVKKNPPKKDETPKAPKEKNKKVNKVRNTKSEKSKPKPKPKPKTKSKTKPKHKPKPKPKPKPPKKLNTGSLFGGVKGTVPKTKPKIKTQKNVRTTTTTRKSASDIISDSLKNKTNDAKGIENAYLAKVSRRLKAWPSQVNYAGEEFHVHLTIYRDGTFKYSIVRPSGNPEMNEVILSYLKQLQSIGFGPHNNASPYDKTFIIRAKSE